MKFNHLLKPILLVMLVLGLLAGCASTPDTGMSDQATAEQAIADAKASNAQAKKMNAEWRDTGKMIKKAEEALSKGDFEKAITLANQAQRQGKMAQTQAKDEEARLMNTGDISSEAASATAVAASISKASSEHGVVTNGVDSYEVVGGDNLWDISAKDNIYANPYQWPMIYKTNRNKIKDADLIYPGQVFDIDRSASGSDIDAAISHAKSRGAWSVGTVESSDEAYLAE